jgi:ATP/maltotriose-dependent transcriptional regulator MalT
VIGSRVEIGSLARSQTEELLTNLGVDCEPDMLRALHKWTDGNPHLLKLAASWLKNSSSESVAESIRSLRDQVEVQGFLLKHLTHVIDPDDRDILKAASIFRDRFSDDALAYVVERSRGSVVDSSLRLVRSYAATRNREGDSAFFHASVKDFVYSRIDRGRKIELHTRAAEWFEQEGDGKEARYHRRRAAELLAK